jgi:hypothetical protein
MPDPQKHENIEPQIPRVFAMQRPRQVLSTSRIIFDGGRFCASMNPAASAFFRAVNGFAHWEPRSSSFVWSRIAARPLPETSRAGCGRIQALRRNQPRHSGKITSL